jgi:hypothetical protein
LNLSFDTYPNPSSASASSLNTEEKR